MDIAIPLLLTSIAGFYMAWNIGANDVANSMGTSVGSKVLTVKQAVFLASILTIIGAVLVGNHVTETIRKGIIDPTAFAGNPEVFVYGMFSVIISAGVWVTISTKMRLPVSTTHSIVGAIIGFGLISSGLSVVNYPKLLGIILSWVISPITGGVIAFILFNMIKNSVLDSEHPFDSAKKVFPLMVSMVFMVLSFAVLYSGCHMNLGGIDILTIVVLVSLFAGLTSMVLLGYYHKSGKDPYYQVEDLFGYLQVLSACCVAFAHGSNDVANAIGPVAAIYHVTEGIANGLTSGILQQSVPVPLWMLAFGGVGIAVGISTWGHRVMETIGERITEITPTRGFAAEFSTAATVLGCSLLGLPISTSHVVVGSVIGVGFAGGINALNLNVVKNIIISWLATIPSAALLTMVIYEILTHVL
ncbi:MAG: phosphate permease [Candidatus Altiarchaeales archaeon ex4484_2]|nr:MAG: phosphate permease [Candidatus Altiarchaeales archaeon ex4484_2]